MSTHIKRIASQKRKTFLRIGGASLGEIETVIEIFRKVKIFDLVLLHGYQNYPTKIENSNISYLSTLNNLFGFPVSLAATLMEPLHSLKYCRFFLCLMAQNTLRNTLPLTEAKKVKISKRLLMNKGFQGL